jgi:hypothetical protein
MTPRFFMVDFPKEAPVTGSTEIHRGTPMMAQWDVKDNAVWFEITPLEETVVCRIDGDTLRKYFGAESSAEVFAMRAFTLHSPAIEALAVEKAARGEFSPYPNRPGRIVWLRGKDVEDR